MRLRSALPKPSGRASRVVSAITRGPEKLRSAPGSAIQMSASVAKLATTPPVQGSTRTATNGEVASLMRSTAQLVLAICIRPRMPSCMRAPPELQTATSGKSSPPASSALRQSFSPTTLPMLPPMKPKSITASTHGVPSRLAVPVTIASGRPVLACASRTRSGYGSRSVNCSGSSVVTIVQSSSNEPSSTSWRMRSRAPRRTWKPQTGHTVRLARRSLRLASSRHEGQTHSGFTGSLPRRWISTVTFMGGRAGRLAVSRRSGGRRGSRCDRRSRSCCWRRRPPSGSATRGARSRGRSPDPGR